LGPPEGGREDAMKMLLRFVVKFTSLIVAVFSCFDRVILG
jgi:hypothetical protein